MKNLIDPKHTALLIIDIQNDYCSSEGKVAKKQGLNVSPIKEMVPNLIDFVDKARQKKLPIIFTQMIGDPDYMSENASLKRGQTSFCTPNTEGFDYYKISPQTSDYQLIKKSYNSFSNPQLEKILIEKNIKTLIITGVNTSICVDSTIRDAFGKGYHIVVPQDLVSMPKEKLYQHNASIDVWDFIFAHITGSQEILNQWKS